MCNARRIGAQGACKCPDLHRILTKLRQGGAELSDKMQYKNFDQFLEQSKASLAKGPIALILAEDAVELDSTLRHHLKIGFSPVILLADPAIIIASDLQAKISRIDTNVYEDGVLVQHVNKLIAAAPSVWLYYCYNSEYLYYPFLETRMVGEMLAFHMEERRDAMISFTVDIYASDLNTYPNAVSRETAQLDSIGYYALAREDPNNHKIKYERQLDYFGGLRWRFEEYVPWTRRRIDRIALFRAKPGLVLRDDYTLSEPEMNTFACPWHNNLTSAIVSFRTAKALRTNPGSRKAINTFMWQNSIPFAWNSQQLMDLGLMEPGQWF
jgi:hypothetical protein